MVTMNLCKDCGIELNKDNWQWFSYKKKVYRCKPCKNSKRRNDPKLTEWRKQDILKTRIDIINNYGGVCECCGQPNILSLTIDHINNDGFLEKNHGHHLYKKLIKNGYPKDNYRLLCWNCNCSRSVLGVCGHHYKDIKLDPLPNINREAPKNKSCRCCFAKLVEGVNWTWWSVKKFDMICEKCSNYNTKIYSKKSAYELKSNIINNYGGICNYCGEDNRYFLTIDHIDGIKDDNLPRSSIELYRFLRNNNYPKDNYQLLCYNCNCIKGFFNYTKEMIISYQPLIIM